MVGAAERRFGQGREGSGPQSRQAKRGMRSQAEGKQQNMAFPPNIQNGSRNGSRHVLRSGIAPLRVIHVAGRMDRIKFVVIKGVGTANGAGAGSRIVHLLAFLGLLLFVLPLFCRHQSFLVIFVYYFLKLAC